MALIPWRPFSELDRFFGDDDWFLPVFPRTGLSKPAMDLYETDKEIVAEISLPGFDPKKVNVSVKDGLLKVSGEVEEENKEEKKGYWRQEIRKGAFERMVRIPPVKEDAVEATHKNGVLKIVMPKAEAEPTSNVEIKVEEDK